MHWRCATSRKQVTTQQRPLAPAYGHLCTSLTSSFAMHAAASKCNRRPAATECHQCPATAHTHQRWPVHRCRGMHRQAGCRITNAQAPRSNSPSVPVDVKRCRPVISADCISRHWTRERQMKLTKRSEVTYLMKHPVACVLRAATSQSPHQPRTKPNSNARPRVFAP